MNALELLQEAHARKASDIHITVNSPVIFRVIGALRPVNDVPLKPKDTEELARQLMSEEKLSVLREKGELDFSYGVPGLARFRVNAFLQRGSIGLAIRIVPSHIPTMEQLSLPGVAGELIQKPQGLLLVTGPTGSGKSTTLASMVNELNRSQSLHIITMEDPIEYIHDHKRSIVNQREVGLDTSSFAAGLKAALRQDPDVLLVGELRDLETISTAITAAETGHLVLATLHTADAPQTIDRIVEVFPADMQTQIRIQLASVLLGVISQRLLPRKDGSGRVAAFEVLVNTPAIANLVRSEKVFQIRSVMQTSRSIGMKTLESSLRELVQQGVVELATAKEALFGFEDL